jgi:hypothetical protein
MSIVAGIAFAFWLIASARVAVCDGSYILDVRVVPTAPAPIRAVTCEAFAEESRAAIALEHLLPPESDLWSASADPFDGQVLTVRIPFTMGRPSDPIAGPKLFD